MVLVAFLSAVPSAGLHWLFRMTQIVVALVVAYLAYLLVRRGWLFVRDMHLLYSLVVGSRYQSVAKNKRLRVFTVPRDQVDEVAISEILNLSSGLLEGEAVTLESTRKVVRQYDLAFFYRDCLDGTLRGFMLAGQAHIEKDGKHYCLMRIGTSLFRKDYTGGPLLYATGLYYCLKQMVLHPRTPLFVLFKVFSYMPYSFCATNFPKCYPRYDHEEIPQFEKSLMDEYGRSLEGPDVKYNPEACVLEKEVVNLRQYVAPIDKDKQKNPHAQFFLERNPGWHKGHQMVVLTEVTWGALFTIAWRVLRKATQRDSEGVRRRRVRYESRRSVSSFVTEEEYMRKHNASPELDDPPEPQSEESVSSSTEGLQSIPEDEQVEGRGGDSDAGNIQTKRSQFVKTQSIMMGVDRIDEYSHIDIHTP